MKVFVIVGFVLAATLQADARAIVHQQIPKVLMETMEQSYSCAMQLGPDVANVPKIQGITQLPEDNPTLNTLWGCIWEKKGIVDKQGVVYPEKLSSYLSDLLTIVPAPGLDVESVVGEMTESCKDVEGSDYKIKSVKMQNCINRYVSAYAGV